MRVRGSWTHGGLLWGGVGSLASPLRELGPCACVGVHQVMFLALTISGCAAGVALLVLLASRLRSWWRTHGHAAARAASPHGWGPRVVSTGSQLHSTGKGRPTVSVVPSSSGASTASGPVDARRLHPISPVGGSNLKAGFNLKFTAWQRSGTGTSVVAVASGSPQAGDVATQAHRDLRLQHEASSLRLSRGARSGFGASGRSDGNWIRAGESVEGSTGTPRRHTSKGTNLVKVQPASGSLRLEQEHALRLGADSEPERGSDHHGSRPEVTVEDVSTDPRQRQAVPVPVIGPSTVRLGLALSESTDGVGGVLSPGGFKLRREGSCASQVTPQTTSMPRPGRPPITVREDNEGE
jgi:hypothetical protein